MPVIWLDGKLHFIEDESVKQLGQRFAEGINSNKKAEEYTPTSDGGSIFVNGEGNCHYDPSKVKKRQKKKKYEGWLSFEKAIRYQGGECELNEDQLTRKRQKELFERIDAELLAKKKELFGE